MTSAPNCLNILRVCYVTHAEGITRDTQVTVRQKGLQLAGPTPEHEFIIHYLIKFRNFIRIINTYINNFYIKKFF